MITVEEASAIIKAQHISLATEIIAMKDALGRMLAENVYADRDMPPFNRVSMDGIAIRYYEYLNGRREWICDKIQYAGEAPVSLEHAHNCIEVMTGAVLPAGCDAVIRYEDLEHKQSATGDKVFSLISEVFIKQHQNIHAQGSDKAANACILTKGQSINATDMALLATVGKHQLSVFCKPRIAIIATGDELTAVETTPECFQIRASNPLMIGAALSEKGLEADRFIVRDEIAGLKQLLDQCMKQYQIVIITGAVSKGKADFIPPVLMQLKTEKLFHGVAQRPAKPFWFGRRANCLVFAMPGNPVSAAVCTYVYLLPFLSSIVGRSMIKYRCLVSEEVTFKPALTYFMQAKINQNEVGEYIATPFQGNGSGDLTNLSEINAFIVLPAGETHFSRQNNYEFYFTR
jgi:molybdopterin molybdotransferase